MGLYDLTSAADRQSIRENLASTVGDDCVWLRSIVEDALNILDRQGRRPTNPGPVQRLLDRLDETDLTGLSLGYNARIEQAVRDVGGHHTDATLYDAAPALHRALKLALAYLYKAKAEGMESVIPVSRAIYVAEEAISQAEGLADKQNDATLLEVTR